MHEVHGPRFEKFKRFNLFKAVKQALSLHLPGCYQTTSAMLESVGKLPLIWAARRLSPRAKAYTLFLKESHLVPIYFDLGKESNKIGSLVSWTNDFRKVFILCGNIIEATELKDVSFRYLENSFLWNTNFPDLHL